MNLLKNEAQDLDDERDMALARKYFAKMQLEGEKPTKFFCNLNKKRLKNYTLLKRNRTERKKFELLQNRKLSNGK